MRRALSCAAVVFLSALVLSCGGDNERRSPTEPPPVTTAPVTLPGNWAGTMTINRSSGPATTCNLSLTVHDEGDPLLFTGDWRLQCPDGSQGNGFAALFSLPFSQVNISALRSVTVLDGCHWASLVPRQGQKLTGEWQKPTGSCPDSAFQGGRLDLTKTE
jgi:hypothetical protein